MLHTTYLNERLDKDTATPQCQPFRGSNTAGSPVTWLLLLFAITVRLFNFSWYIETPQPLNRIINSDNEMILPSPLLHKYQASPEFRGVIHDILPEILPVIPLNNQVNLVHPVYCEFVVIVMDVLVQNFRADVVEDGRESIEWCNLHDDGGLWVGQASQL